MKIFNITLVTHKSFFIENIVANTPKAAFNLMLQRCFVKSIEVKSFLITFEK